MLFDGITLKLWGFSESLYIKADIDEKLCETNKIL